MSATREAEELVQLWQELQAAQVAGDGQRLAALRMLAEARAKRQGASEEWQLLAREAGRYTSQLQEQVEAQPTAGMAAGAEAARYEPAERYDVEEVAVPDSAWEPAEDAEPSRGRRLGPIIWLVIVAAYLILQVIGGLTGGDSP